MIVIYRLFSCYMVFNGWDYPRFIRRSGIGVGYVIFCVFLSIGFMCLSCRIGQFFRNNLDRKVAFECWFDPIRRSRIPFSLPYYLVALLFLVFDIEVVLLICCCVRLNIVHYLIASTGLFLCLVFCYVLFGGLIHEVNEGSLVWK